MCTGVRFSDDEGNMYFGRNLDWSFSYGETILVTPRGYQYDYVYGAEGKSEPNAVIGVGVVMVDRPMYFDCANEHGLAIAGLNFPWVRLLCARAGRRNRKRRYLRIPAVGGAQFRQCRRSRRGVEERDARFIGRARPAGIPAALVHW